MLSLVALHFMVQCTAQHLIRDGYLVPVSGVVGKMLLKLTSAMFPPGKFDDDELYKFDLAIMDLKREDSVEALRSVVWDLPDPLLTAPFDLQKPLIEWNAAEVFQFLRTSNLDAFERVLFWHGAYLGLSQRQSEGAVFAMIVLKKKGQLRLDCFRWKYQDVALTCIFNGHACASR